MSGSEYIPTIGVETHVQLKTKTKLFSAVDNDDRKAAPNSLINHIDVGMPGALPVLNRAAIDLCGLAAFALNTKPQTFSKFERKHYFYPDLPKGYQITQYEDPIIIGGYVDTVLNGQTKRVRIERANLEEDAGKSTHPAAADYSLVDLNRAGTPLLEIVSRPDIHSPAEAKVFARELYLLMKYAGVTDGDLYHGHMRFDLNISLSKETGKLGTRSEVKNLNSFRSVEAAVAYEIKRQTEILEKGGKVVQETRGWDEAKQKTFPQRTKEEAEDYRYMPEPDIPPVVLKDEFLEDIKKQLPRLPADIRAQLQRLDINPQVIEDILDRPSSVDLIINMLNTFNQKDARRLAFWLMQTEPAVEEDPNYQPPKLDLKEVSTLSAMVDANELSSTSAKAIFTEIASKGGSVREKAAELNLLQISDESAIEKVVAEVIAENPKVVTDIKSGQTKAISFLVGQVMAKTKGQADPVLTKKLIKKQLDV